MGRFNYPSMNMDKKIENRNFDFEVIEETEKRVHEFDTGNYRSYVQLLGFQDGDKLVRFSYDRQVVVKKTGNSKWNYGSQTTWSFPQTITEQAIKDAIRKKILFTSQSSRKSLVGLLEENS